MTSHIEAWTKWLTFAENFFKYIFLRKNYFFYQNFTSVCSDGSTDYDDNIGLGNSLVPSHYDMVHQAFMGILEDAKMWVVHVL